MKPNYRLSLASPASVYGNKNCVCKLNTHTSLLNEESLKTFFRFVKLKEWIGNESLTAASASRHFLTAYFTWLKYHAMIRIIRLQWNDTMDGKKGEQREQDMILYEASCHKHLINFSLTFELHKLFFWKYLSTANHNVSRYLSRLFHLKFNISRSCFKDQIAAVAND